MPTNCPTILTSNTQFNACVPAAIIPTFWAKAQQVKGAAWVTQQKMGLLGGYASIPSALVFQLVPVQQTSPGVTVIQGGQIVQVGATYEETHPLNLAQANLAYANEAMSEAPLSLLNQLANDTGVKPGIPEVEKRAGVAIIIAAAATKAGQLIPDVIEHERAKAGAAGSAFFDKFSNGLKKLVTHPGDWLQRVFVTEPGKAVAWAGRQLMSEAIPNWARWVFDPLGLAKQLGTFLQEIGQAMTTGSISAFEEQEFMKANARHWQQVGAALAVAAPFLPPPFNILAAALAAIFTAAGTAILRMYAMADYHREAEADAARLSAQAKAAQARAAAAADQAAFVETLEPATQSQPVAVKSFALDGKAAIFIGSAFLLWMLYGSR